MEILKDFSPIVQHGGNLGELKLVLSAIEPSLRRYGHCPRVEKTINNNPLDSRPACRSRGATAQRGEILSRLSFSPLIFKIQSEKTSKRHQLSMTFPCVFRFLSSGT